MKRFSSSVALTVLAGSIALGLASPVLSLALAGALGFVYPAIFAKKMVIAFDAGGVMTDGDFFTSEVKLRPIMASLVKKLKSKYTVIMLSDQNAVAQKAFDKKFNYSSLFDAQVVSSDVGFRKPSKEIFQYVANKFNVKPKDIVFVDDSKENVDGAKAVGINGIQYVSFDKLLSDLRGLGISF